MTIVPAGEGAAARIQPVAELFSADASALWATTYNIDLALFNEFLLARLGDPPLNIAVLADHRRLTASLERVPAERADTLAMVNRRWVLRGVRTGGAFHPKSYLAITPDLTTLLVGSGNVSIDGLDEGREVFTAFRSGTPIGDAAVATWRSWMRRLVGLVSDTTLAERFRDLEGRLPSPTSGPAVMVSPLLHNLDLPIADQLATAIAETGDEVEELWLTAPFYDPEAVAVGVLLDTFRPRQVNLFVTGSTKVRGDRLSERLVASGARVTVAAYEPDRFVHAKLVGVVAGGHALLLSGSANLSSAALTLTPVAHGNVELAVLAPLDVESLRALFIPPGMTLGERTLSSLVGLDFKPDEEPPLPTILLRSATALADGRVEIATDPSPGHGWLLDDLTNRIPLTGTGGGHAVTVGPLVGRLVQIVDGDGHPLSNRVVVDDPVELAAVLSKGSDRAGGDRPHELGDGDLDTPLGYALLWLHRNLVMDVSERARATGPAGVGNNEDSDQADDEFWDRLEREQLARDPRASVYDRIWRRHVLGSSDPILELLATLGARAPTEPIVRKPLSLLAQLLGRPPEIPPDGEGGHARRWKDATRRRVLARNVLRRWAAAQTDPRLVWVDPLAPAGNFALIVATLAFLHLAKARDPKRVEFTTEDLDDLWQRWLRPFAGAGQGDGWLNQLDDAATTMARDRLPDDLPEAVAALCWLAVRPGSGFRERVLVFQPLIAAALALGLLEPTETTALYLTAVTGRPITRSQVDAQLLEAIEFFDDTLWCEHTVEDLHLEQLTLRAPLPGDAAVRARVDVRGIAEPLLEPTVPRLVLALRHHRHCDGVALFDPDNGWRLVFVTGETIAYLHDMPSRFVQSTEPLSDGALEALAARGGVIADLFPAEVGAVA